MLKKLSVVLSLLLIFGFSATLVGKEGSDAYFPHALGSYWIYEDQDGNELIRYAVEEQEIDGERYSAFNYEPTLEDWADYDYHIHPSFYQANEERVAFLVADDVKEAVKAHLTKEVDIFRTAFLVMMASSGVNLDLLYEVRVEAQDLFYVVPTSVTFNEKWNAMRTETKITMTPEPLLDPGEITFELTVVETGEVLGTEDVETPAGTFQDCLKIEYQTEAKVETFPPDQAPNPPGESTTTLWIAPNVGIVKFHQRAEDILLKAIPLPLLKASTTVKTLELKKYEIKSVDSRGE